MSNRCTRGFILIEIECGRLRISGAGGHCAYFDATDIKELRKFLKKLQRQLEQGDVDG